MNLLEIRTQFIKISGRYDLVVDASAFADNGADFYIQQGQRSLERRLDSRPTGAKYYIDLEVGDYLVKIKNSRVIQEVWILDTDTRTQLSPITHEALRELAYTTPLSSATRAQPQVYYPTSLRRSPDDEDGSGDSALLQTYLDIVSPSDPDYNGIVLYPPVDKAYGLEIVGLFYDYKLTTDTESNYWSSNYPTLLIMAALRELEIMYRGSKTVSRWDEIISAEVAGIDMDSVAQEITHSNRMEG
jgi:hypothetical protein